MGRKKERDAIKVNFNLDVGINERIEQLANFEKVGKSNFIEMLVMRWDEGIDPQIKLNTLFKKREKINNELLQVDLEIKKLNEQIVIFNKVKKEKEKRKPQAIRALVMLLENGEINQAERLSKFWQRETGISSFELLMESQELVQKKNTSPNLEFSINRNI